MRPYQLSLYSLVVTKGALTCLAPVGIRLQTTDKGLLLSASDKGPFLSEHESNQFYNLNLSLYIDPLVDICSAVSLNILFL